MILSFISSKYRAETGTDPPKKISMRWDRELIDKHFDHLLFVNIRLALLSFTLYSDRKSSAFNQNAELLLYILSSILPNVLE
ncbi:hypothetical protein CLOSTMETH_03544 [[Clostridium] methylpentosum DSM 5476]|uniref:Uncharacterized protein n=1 Tax=[Clostridium] methylpentosum DSM 5476 TaxID=537013 RepID=C0EI49_9FIRM|nr:hypothetical protein CLOSTMETH_03544 [[Clostridium] methylpentosum DSM 5476]